MFNKKMISKKMIVSVLLAIALAGCNRSPASYVAKGNKYAGEGKFQDAILQYRKAIEKDSKYADAYYRAGLAEIQLGDIRSAYGGMKRAADLVSGKSDAEVRVGDLAWWISNVDKRPSTMLYNDIDHVSKTLLAANPQDFDGIRFKAYIAVLDKRPDEAIQLLQKANSLHPLYPDVIMLLSRLLAEKGDLIQAETLLRAMVAHKPSYTPGYDALYVLCMQQKRFSDAELILRQRIDKNPRDTNALIQLADYYGGQQNMAGLNATLNRIRDQRSSLPGARMALAQFYAIHKDPGESVREFEQAIKEDPKNELEYRKRMVMVLIAQGKLDQAEANLDKVLKGKPNDPEARRIKAGFDLATRQQAKVSDAVNIYKDLAAQRPDDPDLRFYYARSLIASGDARSARTQLIAAIQRSPNSIAPKLALAGLSVNQAQYADAISLTTSILDQNPTNEIALLFRAVAQAGVGQRDSARGDLNRLLRDHPDSEEAELQLGLLDVGDKRYEEATKIFSKYYQPGQTDQRPLEGLIRSDVTQRQFEKALALLDAEIQKSPKSNSLRLMLALIATSAGKFDVAEAQYRLMASQSDSSAIQFQWAELLHTKGDAQHAMEHYRRAKELDPKNTSAAALLGRELEAAGRRTEAIASYRDALKADPNNVFALNNLAFALADTGQNLDEALQMALSAQKLIKDNNTAVADTVGWVYLKKGLTSSALLIFQNDVRRDPKNSAFHYHLAAALLASGDKLRAKEELQKALQSSPSPIEEPTIRGLLAKIG
jgi:tetratricopeptide (TPR) repeat protein